MAFCGTWCDCDDLENEADPASWVPCSEQDRAVAFSLAADAFRTKLAYGTGAELACAAERARQVAPPNPVEAAVLSSVFDVKEHVEGNAFALSWFEGHADLYFAVRGTELKDLLDVKDDVDVMLTEPEWAEGTRVHEGFLRHLGLILGSLEERIRASAGARQLHFLGHSLGGAVASLAAYRWASAASVGVSLVTFGAPRSGDAAFVAWSAGVALRSRMRVVVVKHESDPVPMVPPFLASPWFGVSHVLTDVREWLPSPREHSMDLYQKRCRAVPFHARAR